MLPRESPASFSSSPLTFAKSPPTFGKSPSAFPRPPLTSWKSPPAFARTSPTSGKLASAGKKSPVTFRKSPLTLRKSPSAFARRPQTFRKSPVTAGKLALTARKSPQTFAETGHPTEIQAFARVGRVCNPPFRVFYPELRTSHEETSATCRATGLRRRLSTEYTKDTEGFQRTTLLFVPFVYSVDIPLCHADPFLQRSQEVSSRRTPALHPMRRAKYPPCPCNRHDPPG